MNGRNMIQVASAALAASILAFTGAQAAAPFAGTQAPGFYRMMLGEFEVTVLSGGTNMLPASTLLTNVSPAQVQQALASSFLKEPVPTSVNEFLINTGAKLVLIDTGNGERGDSKPAILLANLRASGYQPEQVDEVYLTHMHGDHIGGLTVGALPAFPNAIVRADQREADNWLSPSNLNIANKDAKGRFEGARAALAPYIAAGRFKTFDGDTDLVPGVRSRACYGHTPGHTMYVVESKGEKLVLWGDLMHVAVVQFTNPAVTIRYDSDSAAAAAQRQKVLADAAGQGYWIGGAHLAFPGLGHVTKAGDAYAWVPVNYSRAP